MAEDDEPAVYRRFSEWVEKHYSYVFHFALHLCGDRDRAADLTQDTFVAFQQSFAWRVDQVKKPQALLLTICGNKYKNRLRERAHFQQTVERLGAKLPLAAGGPGGGEPELEAFWACLDELANPDERTLVLANRVCEIPLRELAAEWNCSTANLSTRLLRVLRRLECCVDRRCGKES